MARSLGGGAVGKLFKSMPAIGVCLVLLGCTLEESSIISGRVTDVLANDVIRVGDKDVRLCGVKATTKNSPWYYAAKGYLIDRVQYRKVQCHIADTVTPCDDQANVPDKARRRHNVLCMAAISPRCLPVSHPKPNRRNPWCGSSKRPRPEKDIEAISTIRSAFGWRQSPPTPGNRDTRITARRHKFSAISRPKISNSFLHIARGMR